jgi:hypothetical protein
VTSLRTRSRDLRAESNFRYQQWDVMGIIISVTLDNRVRLHYKTTKKRSKMEAEEAVR